MKRLLLSIQLFFFPTSFRESEVEHVRKLNAAGRVYGDPDMFRPEAEKRIAKKRQGLLRSFLVVGILALVGFVTAILVNDHYPLSLVAVRLIRLASIVIIAWAVLGRIGYETPTMGGETLLEITSANAFKQMYGLGVLLGTFALFLDVPGI